MKKAMAQQKYDKAVARAFVKAEKVYNDSVAAAEKKYIEAVNGHGRPSPYKRRPRGAKDGSISPVWKDLLEEDESSALGGLLDVNLFHDRVVIRWADGSKEEYPLKEEDDRMFFRRKDAKGEGSTLWSTHGRRLSYTNLVDGTFGDSISLSGMDRHRIHQSLFRNEERVRRERDEEEP